LVYREGVAMRLPGLLLPTILAAAPVALQDPGTASFAGSWAGAGKFAMNVGATSCTYVGLAQPASVVAELTEKDGTWAGHVSLDLPGVAGSPCPPFKARYRVGESRLSANSLGFADASNNQWTLTLRQGRLQGVASSSTGFSGEVDLARTNGSKAVSQPASAASSPSPTSQASPTQPAPDTSRQGAAGGGSAWRGIATVVGASTVGVGAFLGVNRLLKDSGGTGSGATCSPRTCVAGAVGDPCTCNANLTTGASCGTTTAGVPFAGVCNFPSLPCESDLSCNNGLCEDRFGRCPF